MILAYLIEPGRADYELDDLAAEYGLELIPEPEAEEETAALVRHAAATLRLRDPMLERVRERGAEPLYREIELPLTTVLAAMEAAGVKVDTYRMGEITARLADRVEELEAKAYELAGEEFMLGSTQQVARILFEKLELTPGRKGKTGYSTDTPRPPLDPRRPRDRPRDRGVARVLEAARTPTSARCRRMIGEDGRLHTTFNQTVAATGPPLDDEPEPAGDPDPHRPRPRDPLGLRRRGRLQARLGRLLAGRAAHPRARVRRAEAEGVVRARARTSTRRPRPRCSARIRRR